MSLQLPIPFTLPLATQWKQKLEQADANNLKSGTDVIIGSLPNSPRQSRLILTDENGGKWQITVSTTGALSTKSLTL
jgi:hypothetical protein